MKKVKFLFFIFLLSLIAFSCNKDKELEIPNEEIISSGWEGVDQSMKILDKNLGKMLKKAK